MSTKFTNNASSKLTQALTADATSMHIQAEDVSKFPVLGAEDFCRLTIVGDHGDHEIVKVTSISSDGTCTIERAQESTTAKEWPIENKVELRITAEYLNSTADNSDITDIKNEINNIVDYIPLDGVTITKSPDGKLQVKDIAIGGDKNSLASKRGQIGLAQYKTGVDLNDIIDAGFYLISAKTPSQNVPINTNMYLHVFRNKSFGVVQIAYMLNKSDNVPLYVRRLPSSGTTWTPWVQFLDVSSIGDGITVNNGIISVPEYEGATSSTAATSGLVPPATSAERNNFLRGDGTWQQVDLSDYALKTELTNYLPLKGTAASATKLATARTIRTNLSSTKAASFNGTANITPGVTGVLPVANGGTGSNKEKYLPLTGGTITGALTVNDWLTVQTGVRHNGTRGELLMCSGSTWNDSPSLSLYGSSHPISPGNFAIRTGEDSKSLSGTSDGQLIWDGKHIVRSVGGVSADATGNVNAPYLPIIGSYNLNVPTGEFGVGTGTVWNDSSSFTLYGNSRTDGNAGMFSIRAKSTSAESVDFIGRPSGQLTWGGRHIVRHINGIYADEGGGVDITGIVPNKAYHSDVLTGTIGGYGGPVTLPNYGTWAYVGTTNYRGWGTGSSDGSSYGGVEPGGTTLNFYNRGTGYLIVRVA